MHGLLARAIGVPVLIVAATAAPLAGQHATSAGSTPVGERGCGACHRPHGGAPNQFNLLTDDVAVWVSGGAAGRLGDVDRSCLRCHLSEAVRDRQPDVAAVGSGAHGWEGRYLGYDLTRQHPLGSLDAVRRSVDDAGRRTRHPTATPLWTDTDRITCTSCHDPHDRTGARPEPSVERAVCGACHDPAVYAFGHDALACSDCHAVHASLTADLLRGGEGDEACRACHERDPSLPPEKVPARGLSEVHGGVTQTLTDGCQHCHTIHP